MEGLLNTVFTYDPGKMVNNHFVFSLSSLDFLYVDPALKKLLRSELKSIEDVLTLSGQIDSPDLIMLEDAFHSLRKNEPVGILHFHIFLDNQMKFLLISPVLFTRGDDKLLAGTVSDHTALMHNINSVRKYANKKNSILTLLAHDLRGPLAVSYEVLNTLTRTPDDNTDSSNLREKSIQKRIVNVRTAISQCVNIITDLVHREFLETVETELVYQSIDVALRLDEYMEEARKSDDAAKRSFSFRSSAKNIVLGIDESKFMQIMNNLMSNALKFTNDGDHISLEIKEESESVLFIFSDNGIGIPAKDVPRLFKKFTEARRKGLKGEPTIGLGLYLVDMIVKWHKGEITVKSEGKGTTFYFRLPKNIPASR